MIIDNTWRILTIGDGDLSFSNALLNSHQPAALTATVYDSLDTLSKKYGNHFYHQLNAQKTPVLFEFDINDKNSWSTIKPHSFDLVIFQFPLLPAFKSFNDYQQQCGTVNPNILNRRLLRTFLINSTTHFLDPQGQQLCFITSKDVKPYRQWNIENALHLCTDIHYLGSIPFDISLFPGYKIRNVDRDKHVKDTQGITYVWSRQQHPIKHHLSKAQFQGDNYCSACRSGPFLRKTDKIAHQNSKKHKQMMELEDLWLTDIEN